MCRISSFACISKKHFFSSFLTKTTLIDLIYKCHGFKVALHEGKQSLYKKREKFQWESEAAAAKVNEKD